MLAIYRTEENLLVEVTEAEKGDWFNLVNPTAEEISKLMADVIKDINKKLPGYKNIKKINIRETEFIKTTTSKIKRYANMDDEVPASENKQD